MSKVEGVTLTDSIQCDAIFVIYIMNDDPHDNDRFGSIEKNAVQTIPLKIN